MTGLRHHKRASPPSPRGLGSRGASLQLQRWLTPGHCRPPAASTPSLVEVPGKKYLNFIMLFFSEQVSIIFSFFLYLTVDNGRGVWNVSCLSFLVVYCWLHSLNDTNTHSLTFWEPSTTPVLTLIIITHARWKPHNPEKKSPLKKAEPSNYLILQKCPPSLQQQELLSQKQQYRRTYNSVKFLWVLTVFVLNNLCFVVNIRVLSFVPCNLCLGGSKEGIKSPTSMRLVMKKLFCRAQTPFSGRMDVCRHTGHESVRDSGGM